MPQKKTVQRARKDKRQGKAPTTQAGEFVREEMDHMKQGKHSSNNPKQAIAIGLSKARRAGVKVGAPKKGKASPATRKRAQRDLKAGQRKSASKSSASAHRTSASGRKKTASRSGGTKHRSTAKKTSARKR